MSDRPTGRAALRQDHGFATTGAGPDVYADPRFLGRPDLPPGAQEVARKAIEEPEPFNLAWNSRGGEGDAVVREAMGKLQAGESAPETGFLQDLDRRLQAILDQPRAEPAASQSRG